MNDEINDSVIQKIQKLLALSNDNANQHESSLAAKMAANLMRKHNIEIADVLEKDLLKKDLSGIVDQDINDWAYKRKWPLWLTTLAIGVSELFDCHCKCVYDFDREGYKLKLYGHKSDVKVAKWMFAYLIDSMDYELDKYVKSDDVVAYGYTKAQVRIPFLVSASSVLGERLKELGRTKNITTSSGTNLLVIKNQMITEKYGEFSYGTRTSNVNNYQAYTAGGVAGEKININTVVENDSKDTALLS